jgi:hypothetical protein
VVTRLTLHSKAIRRGRRGARGKGAPHAASDVQAFVGFMAGASDRDQVLSVLRRMAAAGLPASVKSFNALLAHARRIHQAEALLHWMRELGITPDATTEILAGAWGALAEDGEAG